MAFVKITSLPATSTITANDLFVLVDDPNGNPTTKKIAVGDLLPFFQGQVGPPGPPGPSGAGIIVLGVVANPSLLPISGGNVGDAYIDLSTGDLYVWDGASWQNAGPSGAPGVGVPVGGAAGEVLAKIDGTNYNTQWIAFDDTSKIPLALVDAKGDLIAGTANDTVARLAAGTNGHILYANSATATGLEWAAPPAGTILEYAYTASSTLTVSTSPFNSVSISYTPQNASSLLLVEASFCGYVQWNGVTTRTTRSLIAKIRDTTNSVDVIADSTFGRELVAASTVNAPSIMSVLMKNVVSASSTSARTYQLQLSGTADLEYGVVGTPPTIISVTEIQP